MARFARWQVRKLTCPEAQGEVSLLLEWQGTVKRPVLAGVCCDNPRLRDLDNWECDWRCWERLATEGKRSRAQG